MPRVAGTDGPAASTIIKCRGLLRDIATNLGTTVDNLEEVNCDSQGFLRALKAILEQRGINNVDGLAPVLDEIRVFKEKRKAGGASKGSSHGDHWQPWEANQVLNRAPPPALQVSSQGNVTGDDDQAELAPPSPMSGSSVDSPSFEPLPPDTRVIFCGTSPFENIAVNAENAMLMRISVWPSDATQAGKGIGLLTADEFLGLQRKLGLGLCCCHGVNELKRQAEAMEERAKEREKRAQEQQSGGKTKRKSSGKTQRKSTASMPAQDEESDEESDKGSDEEADKEPAALAQDEQEVVFVHHAVVSMLWALATGRVAVSWHNWDWVQEKIDSDSLLTYLSNIEESRVIIFTLFDNHQWGARDLHTFYDKVKLAPSRVSTYPSEAETFSMNSGLQDIQAFDAIAADPATPWEYAYRVITCVGYGACALADYIGKVAHRKTFPTAEDRVHFEDPSDLESSHPEQLSLLRCTRSGHTRRAPGGRRTGVQQQFAYHQQFIDTIESWGKCRVWMAGGTILRVALTKFSPRMQDWRTDELDLDIAFDFLDRSDGPSSEEQRERDRLRRNKKLEELHRYCKWWYKRLPQVNPQLFASLEVGVRFDICISEKSRRGRFFILEATRWPLAHSFGDSVLGYPYDSFAKAFGTRFSEQYGTRVAAVPVPEESGSDEEESSISREGDGERGSDESEEDGERRGSDESEEDGEGRGSNESDEEESGTSEEGEEERRDSDESEEDEERGSDDSEEDGE